jgi:hypothetical protein
MARCIAVVATLMVIALSSCSSGTPARPLSSAVVTSATPYTPWPRDPLICDSGNRPCAKDALQEIRSGPLRIAGAAYMDCDGIGVKTLRQDRWVASVLRNWADWTAKPVGAISLCVSQFSTDADAVKAFRQVKASSTPLGGMSSPIAVAGLGHAEGFSQNYPPDPGQLDYVAFQTGTFVTTIQASIIREAVGPLRVGHGSEAVRVITELARRQYASLINA